MRNQFEEQEAIPEVAEHVASQREIEIDAEIARIESTNKGLRAMGLHNTANMNQPKLDRLLREKRELQEG